MFFLIGCASSPQFPPASVPKASSETNAQDDVIFDPLEDLNREIFWIMRGIDKYFFYPLTEIYETCLPNFMQGRIHDFCENFIAPVSIINSILQFDFEKTVKHFARFSINTVFGLGGLVDVCDMAGLEYSFETFGKTLKRYGVGPGIYMMLPILGPTTARDGIGKIADFAMHPVNWIFNKHGKTAVWTQIGIQYLDQRLRYRDSSEELHKNFSDPYVVIRGVYYETHGDLKTGNYDALKEETPSPKVEKNKIKPKFSKISK